MNEEATSVRIGIQTVDSALAIRIACYG
jgi:hypothetical protein